MSYKNNREDGPSKTSNTERNEIFNELQRLTSGLLRELRSIASALENIAKEMFGLRTETTRARNVNNAILLNILEELKTMNTNEKNKASTSGRPVPLWGGVAAAGAMGVFNSIITRLALVFGATLFCIAVYAIVRSLAYSYAHPPRFPADPLVPEPLGGGGNGED